MPRNQPRGACELVRADPAAVVQRVLPGLTTVTEGDDPWAVHTTSVKGEVWSYAYGAVTAPEIWRGLVWLIVVLYDGDPLTT